jgi:pimeloyl-ACP methyl ester carboxylesterase
MRTKLFAITGLNTWAVADAPAVNTSTLTQPLMTLAAAQDWDYMGFDLRFPQADFDQTTGLLAAQLRDRPDNSAVLVASSHGGWIGAGLLADRPRLADKLRHIVLVDPYYSTNWVLPQLKGKWRVAAGNVLSRTGYRRPNGDRTYHVPGWHVRQQLAPANNLLDGRLRKLRGMPITLVVTGTSDYARVPALAKLMEELDLHRPWEIVYPQAGEGPDLVMMRLAEVLARL